MGLSIYLVGPETECECRCNCGHVHTTREQPELFHGFVTHNLGSMARAAGIYEVLWRCKYQKARELIEPLTVGLRLLMSDPKRFKYYDSPNGWGTYYNLVSFVRDLGQACEEHPDADIICEP